MKLPKSSENGNNRKSTNGIEAKRINRHNRARQQDHVTEMLKLCLQKVCELQAELENEADDTHDAVAEGYAACATETLRFLTAQGLGPEHPMVRSLTEMLLRNRD